MIKALPTYTNDEWWPCTLAYTLRDGAFHADTLVYISFSKLLEPVIQEHLALFLFSWHNFKQEKQAGFWIRLLIFVIFLSINPMKRTESTIYWSYYQILCASCISVIELLLPPCKKEHYHRSFIPAAARHQHDCEYFLINLVYMRGFPWCGIIKLYLILQIIDCRIHTQPELDQYQLIADISVLCM